MKVNLIINGYHVAKYPEWNEALFRTGNLNYGMLTSQPLTTTLSVALFHDQSSRRSFNTYLKVKLLYKRYLFWLFLSLSRGFRR